MLIAQYFVEFIFYSFLGWVWESIYCTANEKKWADRGFLFGPVCPIYGSCVVVTSFVFSLIPAFSDPDFPLWAIFIICLIGSAIAEFGTSWVLEKRFHARWWDYSDLPLNIQGRICLPVSICFGIAGVLIVKYLIPFVAGMHEMINPLVYEVLALLLAGVFGADFALTEASLSSLLKDVERMHAEYVERAQANYERVHNNLDFNQKRILVSIERFMPDKRKTADQNHDRLMLTRGLKTFVRNHKEKKQKDITA